MLLLEHVQVPGHGGKSSELVLQLDFESSTPAYLDARVQALRGFRQGPGIFHERLAYAIAMAFGTLGDRRPAWVKGILVSIAVAAAKPPVLNQLIRIGGGDKPEFSQYPVLGYVRADGASAHLRLNCVSNPSFS